MKILILKDKINDSMKSTLNGVKAWFSPFIDIEFTEEKTNLKIVNGDYSYIDTLGKEQKFQAVDETWFDENISKPAKARGFDIVIFVIPKKNWISRIVEGFGTSIPDWGIEEIAVPLFTSGTYQFNDVKLKGEKMFWVLVHEILHRVYNIKGLEDNTHKYFLEGKPEKCLEDFKSLSTNQKPIVNPLSTWKHFKLKEKTGSLGHTVADLDTRLVDMLDELRDICGFPFIITSGYRTVAENAGVGGVEGSAHTKRLAVDISCTDSSRRIKIVGEAYAMGFVGIGIAKDFVHLDIDKSEKQRIFLY